MEYKYNPIVKHLTYFLIAYMFLRHQKLMSNELLLANSVVVTLFIIVLDHVFISGHMSPFESMSDTYFDNEEIDKIKQELKEEEKQKRKAKKKQRRLEEEASRLNEVQNTQIQNEINYINGNHPVQRSEMVNQCNSHSEFVNITNGLDNYSSNNNKSNKYNTYEDDLYPEYLAYNE
jgi:hypothetical protein